MGLDQYAFATREAIGTEDKTPKEIGDGFYWRKHAKLQAFFDSAVSAGEVELFNKDDTFNCNPIKLTLEVVKTLERVLNNRGLPESYGGFFFGHQFQDESALEYREQDLAFCKWAEKSIKKGHHVYYDCWY